MTKGQGVVTLNYLTTVSLFQQNLHIVDSLDMPEEDHEYLSNLVESRGWGLSVLFVDE